MKKKTLLIVLLIIIITISLVIVKSKFLQTPQKPQKTSVTMLNPTESMTKSEHALTEAAKKSPKDPERYYILGTFYLNHNRLDDAIKAFKDAIAINDKHGPSLENLGLAYYKKKDYDKALTYLKRALEVIPNTATLHNTLGGIYRTKKMYPEALNAHKKAIELQPDYYEAYYNIALLYQDMKSPEESNAWKKYIELASKIHSEAQYVEFAKKNLNKLK